MSGALLAIELIIAACLGASLVASAFNYALGRDDGFTTMLLMSIGHAIQLAGLVFGLQLVVMFGFAFVCGSLFPLSLLWRKA